MRLDTRSILVTHCHGISNDTHIVSSSYFLKCNSFRGSASEGGELLGGVPAQGVYLLRGRGHTCLRGYLPRGVPAGGVPAQVLPLWTDRHLWKHNLRKHRLWAVIMEQVSTCLEERVQGADWGLVHETQCSPHTRGEQRDMSENSFRLSVGGR